MYLPVERLVNKDLKDDSGIYKHRRLTRDAFENGLCFPSLYLLCRMCVSARACTTNETLELLESRTTREINAYVSGRDCRFPCTSTVGAGLLLRCCNAAGKPPEYASDVA